MVPDLPRLESHEIVRVIGERSSRVV